MGRLSVDLWPLPAVAVDDVRLQTRPPISVTRVEARPVWTALLLGRLEIATLLVRQAVLPQTALAALGAAMQKKDEAAAKPAAPGPSASVVWPRRAVLDAVSWIDGQGRRTTMDAKAALAGDGLLQEASFKVVGGRFVGARGELRREADHWPVRVDIGGGTIRGKLQLQPAVKGGQLLQGQLRTENVELAALTAPSRTLTGKLQAQTTLRAEFREVGQLGEVLRTQTRFDVRNAVLEGIDLARAVQTAGLSRGGSTRLDTLAGQVTTQGKALQLTKLVATSGVLAASGNVAISASQALSGRLSVELQAAGAGIGVPLAVGGTLSAPSVTLTRGALGALAAPGGAANAAGRLGDTFKGLFGR
jgi:hypothetical protein